MKQQSAMLLNANVVYVNNTLTLWRAFNIHTVVGNCPQVNVMLILQRNTVVPCALRKGASGFPEPALRLTKLYYQTTVGSVTLNPDAEDRVG